MERTVTERRRWELCSRIWRMSRGPGPEVQGVRVTARNWQDPPGNRWAYWHVAELLPAYQGSRGDGPARPLPVSAAAEDHAGLPAAPVPRAGQSATPGPISTAADAPADPHTDAYLVLPECELVS